jgi:hypothetical protein
MQIFEDYQRIEVKIVSDTVRSSLNEKRPRKYLFLPP